MRGISLCFFGLLDSSNAADRDKSFSDDIYVQFPALHNSNGNKKLPGKTEEKMSFYGF